MPSYTVVLSITISYLAASLLIGMWPGRKASGTAEGFVAGDRRLGLVLMYFITGATIFSAFAFLGGPGWAYSKGPAAFYILGYGALGFIPFYFLGPRAARLGRRYGFVTQAEMVAARFRMPALAGVMAVVSVVAYIPYLALQMKGAGYVLSAVTGEKVPDWLGSALVYGVVLLYVLRSGVLGVGWTNTFQGLFMMVLAWVLGLYLPFRLHGGVEAMFRAIMEERPDLLEAPGLTAEGTPWSWGEYSSAVIVSAVGFSVWPHLFMKAFTSRDDRTIRRTVILYPTFQIFLVPLFIIGFCGILFHSAPGKPDQILPHMLMHMEIPAVLVGLFCAGALAASMSSGDTMAHASASIAVRDGLVNALGIRLDPEKQRVIIRWVLVLVMGTSYIVAVTVDASLVNMLLVAYGPIVQFAPVIVATLYLRRTTGAAVLSGLIAGSLATLCFVLWPGLRPWPLHAGLYGLAVNIVVLAVVTPLTFRGDTREDEAFLDVARTEQATNG